jgi:putative methyltransferase (TIGR04325 family)
MNYDFLNKLLVKSFTKFFPKTINRKLFRKYNIFFVPTKLFNLPKNFYPVTTNLRSQTDFIFQFDKNKKLINETTKKNLDKFLFNLYKKYPFSFLDVGGDNIDLYLFLSNKLNIKKYFVLNFPEIISIFNKIKSQFGFKKFYPINKINLLRNVDFVYFGSCIQYFKNYKSFLKIIFKKKPKYILFSGTSFFYNSINKDTLVVKQTNILPSTVYLFFFNYKNFINFFDHSGYKLVSSTKNNTTKVNYENFKPLLQKVEYLDLLFKKK